MLFVYHFPSFYLQSNPLKHMFYLPPVLTIIFSWNTKIRKQFSQISVCFLLHMYVMCQLEDDCWHSQWNKLTQLVSAWLPNPLAILIQLTLNLYMYCYHLFLTLSNTKPYLPIRASGHSSIQSYKSILYDFPSQWKLGKLFYIDNE